MSALGLIDLPFANLLSGITYELFPCLTVANLFQYLY